MRMTPEQVREVLNYDPETGVLTWRERPLRLGLEARDRKWNKKFVGKRAGRVGTFGHWYVMITYILHSPRNYASHRLAWAHYHGEWPPNGVDHINGNPADNRIANLRLATQSQNCRNTKLRWDNTSGTKGVSWHKGDERWYAVITVNGKQRLLGRFHSKEEAIAARQRAAAELFGEFARETKVG